MVVALSIYFVKYTQYYAVNEVQYFNLAKALANGHFYIDEQPSEALLAMSNPYDTVARNMDGVTFLWDYAFIRESTMSILVFCPVLFSISRGTFLLVKHFQC